MKHKKNIPNQVLQIIQNAQLHNSQFLLAVSGGLDSMCLMHIFHQLKLSFEVAHINYGFRPEEADNESALVAQEAAKYGVTLHIKHIAGYDALEASDENNLQIFARNIRYRFFEELMQHHGLQSVVTAHHQDDQVETIMLNFFKGTGIAGLKGMSTYAHNKLRPLLSISREELKEYAAHHQIAYLDDSSNLSDRYDRNYLRNQIIPALENRFPKVKNNIAANAQKIAGFTLAFEKMIRARMDVLVEEQPHRTFVFIDKILSEKYVDDIALQLLANYGFFHLQLQELYKLFQSKNGSHLDSGTYLFIKENNRLVIVEKKEHQNTFVFNDVEEMTQSIVHLLPLSYKFEVLATIADDINGLQVLDASLLTFPIVIRLHQAGDYFYPLGLNKKKKISKYLIDEKIPVSLRAQQYVMISNHKIIALLGHRIDHRFRLQASSDSILKIQKVDAE